MGGSALKFPFKFLPLRPEETAMIQQNFGFAYELVRVGPKGYVLSTEYEVDAENIYNLALRADDVIVDTFPRSGTTWTQELVWLIVNNLDYEAASLTLLRQRYVFLEFSSFFTSKSLDKILAVNEADGTQADIELLRSLTVPGSEVLSKCPPPRFIKTHLPLSLLPPTTVDTTKVVYVARDPRDVAVSFYHQNKLFTFLDFKGDFKTYWKLFKYCSIYAEATTFLALRGNKATTTVYRSYEHLMDVLMTPYFAHVKEAWEQRHHPNMLFLFYEELSGDLPATVRRVAEFYGKQYSEEQVAGLCEHLDFKNFKNNKSVNANELEGMNIMTPKESFVRKGKVGGWRDYFDDEMAQDAERWMADNLRDTDLRFPHLAGTQ